MMPDLVTSVLVPPLLAEIRRRSPGSVVEVLPWQGPSTRTAHFLRSLDVACAWTPDAFPGFQRHDLYADRDILVARFGHPRAAEISTLSGLIDLEHVAVIGQGEGDDPVDVWLDRQGLRRRVSIRVPTYLQALRIVASSDLLGFVPSRLVSVAGSGLQAYSPAIDPGLDQQYLFYPASRAADPANRWLRSLMLDVGRELGRLPSA